MPINHTLLLVFVIGATAGLIWTGGIWSARTFYDKLIKTYFCGFGLLGIVIALKLFGLI